MNVPEADLDTLLIAGGAGFIGSALCRYLIEETGLRVVCLDKLTYAASPDSLSSIERNPRFVFERGDIADEPFVAQLLARYQPDAIVNLAAETHVDRSIDTPHAFVETNVIGTFKLLEAARRYWRSLSPEHQRRFKFLQVSTDEVFGSLQEEDGRFSELTPYSPRSPYSATKASSDHLVRAWHHTYGLPTIVTNCSNNYGPYQFPEKLIPLVIIRAINGQSIPVYGSGQQIRDWLFVEDHVRALYLVLCRALPGTTYNIGGGAERRNIDVVSAVCDLIDGLGMNLGTIGRMRNLIVHVEDRPGHDHRYAINSEKLQADLGWRPIYSFENGLRATVAWYLNHADWWADIVERRYDTSRLGLRMSG